MPIMRHLICAMGCLATMLTLVGCGQSGDLQLTSDPHLDTRPKYLLYHTREQQKSQYKDTQSASEVTSSQAQ